MTTQADAFKAAELATIKEGAPDDWHIEKASDTHVSITSPDREWHIFICPADTNWRAVGLVGYTASVRLVDEVDQATASQAVVEEIEAIERGYHNRGKTAGSDDAQSHSDSKKSHDTDGGGESPSTDTEEAGSDGDATTKRESSETDGTVSLDRWT